jgi:hypothetical protein
MGIFRSQGGYISSSTFRRLDGKIAVACVVVFSAIALVGFIAYVFVHHSKAVQEKIDAPSAQGAEAELVSAKGMVMVCKRGQTEWREVKTGSRLKEGDLVQTNDSGTASIRYSNGITVLVQENTIFTVQDTSEGTMEITAPLQPTMMKGRTVQGNPAADGGSKGIMLSEATAGEQMPSMELQRIIPFGRSLELIGHVEAGSRLSVNGESVEIAGDGSFKHFTNPFPSSASKANLVMKVTNLAGQTRTLRTAYDFSSSGGEY